MYEMTLEMLEKLLQDELERRKKGYSIVYARAKDFTYHLASSRVLRLAPNVALSNVGLSWHLRIHEMMFWRLKLFQGILIRMIWYMLAGWSTPKGMLAITAIRAG